MRTQLVPPALAVALAALVISRCWRSWRGDEWFFSQWETRRVTGTWPPGARTSLSLLPNQFCPFGDSPQPIPSSPIQYAFVPQLAVEMEMGLYVCTGQTSEQGQKHPGYRCSLGSGNRGQGCPRRARSRAYPLLMSHTSAHLAISHTSRSPPTGDGWARPSRPLAG